MNLIPKLTGSDLAWTAIPIAFLLYVLLLVDARRRDSPSAGDDQLGIKTVAATLAVVSTLLVAIGLQEFLVAILTFDDVGARLKVGMPWLIVGALGVVGAALVLFPRTNADQYPKAKRLAAGVVALVSGIAMLPALAAFLTVLFDWPSWRLVATALATAVVAVVIFAISVAVLGKLSGVRMPEAKSRPARAQPSGMQPPGQPMQPPGVPPQGYPGQPGQPGYPGQQGYPGQPPGGAPGQGWPQG